MSRSISFTHRWQSSSGKGIASSERPRTFLCVQPHAVSAHGQLFVHFHRPPMKSWYTVGEFVQTSVFFCTCSPNLQKLTSVRRPSSLPSSSSLTKAWSFSLPLSGCSSVKKNGCAGRGAP